MRETSSHLGELVLEGNGAGPHMRRHHVFVKVAKDVQLAEVGPRFEMKRKPERISSLVAD